ncbi:unnamed protein product [Moneuplotes crassus]|uniref:Uncharacterized protein n=1 Tax=Euplotes crassus TaxID=5936 RepID=A0AAD1UI47_EUPCR|nr:unnamed protein product [Moneuplotes crassus]
MEIKSLENNYFCIKEKSDLVKPIRNHLMNYSQPSNYGSRGNAKLCKKKRQIQTNENCADVYKKLDYKLYLSRHKSIRAQLRRPSMTKSKSLIGIRGKKCRNYRQILPEQKLGYDKNDGHKSNSSMQSRNLSTNTRNLSTKTRNLHQSIKFSPDQNTFLSTNVNYCSKEVREGLKGKELSHISIDNDDKNLYYSSYIQGSHISGKSRNSDIQTASINPAIKTPSYYSSLNQNISPMMIKSMLIESKERDVSNLSYSKVTHKSLKNVKKNKKVVRRNSKGIKLKRTKTDGSYSNFSYLKLKAKRLNIRNPELHLNSCIHKPKINVEGDKVREKACKIATHKSNSKNNTSYCHSPQKGKPELPELNCAERTSDQEKQRPKTLESPEKVKMYDCSFKVFFNKK